MIVQRVVAAVIAATSAAVAAVVVIVSAIYAVFALLVNYVSAAGATAIIAGAIAVVLMGVALAFRQRAKAPKLKTSSVSAPADVSVSERLLGLAQDKPIVAATAAVAAGLLAWRNPKLVGTVLRAFEVGRA